MEIVVQKYGGSSVANPELIKNVARRVIATKQAGNKVVVVVSAMGDTTDDLIALAGKLSNNPPKREMDMLMSTGEQITISLLAMTLQAMGHSAISLTGPQAGIYTNRMFSKAKIQEVNPERVLEELEKDNIVVVAGFQGKTYDGEITTLGRGGSDTTAVALAAALKAKVCEIYTDVDGVYSADPRIVPNARKWREISYGEMLEMASLGAVVLQPRAVEYAAIHGVVIHVRSSFKQIEGTFVRSEADLEKDVLVTAVTKDEDTVRVVVVDVDDKPGIAARLFSALADQGVNVDMIVQTYTRGGKTDMLFTVSRSDLNLTLEVVKGIKEELGASDVLYDDTVAKVSIVGAGMVSNPGVAAKMFKALYDAGINIQAISTSEIKVSCLIDQKYTLDAVRAIHKEFELDLSAEQSA
ncbi:MAG TPA: aspartate kinase [Firmicutes bacterium]|nr:aspartate kinase [Bacillota bacterium]